MKKNNKDVAVITDAGTPAISDPAYKLVRKAIEIVSKIEAIPGASAVLTALVSSGLPTDRFLFEGFLPPKKGRKKRIEKKAHIITQKEKMKGNAPKISGKFC